MSSSADDEQRQRRRNMCGYCGRTVISIIGMASIGCSLYASTTCDFISYEVLDGKPQTTLEEPFDRAVKAKVGIFQYQVLQVEGRTPVDESCDTYDDMFQDMADTYPSLTSAQFCALIAPIAAALALFLNFFECFFCSFYASFLFTGFLFLAATGIQAGTFSLVADPEFCFTENQKCQEEVGVYAGIIATIGFFVAATLLCCMPRPDPCCFARLRKESQEQNQRAGRTRLSHQNDGNNNNNGPSKSRPPPATAKPVPPRRQGSKQPPTSRKTHQQPKRNNNNNNRPSSFSDEEQSRASGRGQEQYASSEASSSESSESSDEDDNKKPAPIKRKASRTTNNKNKMNDTSQHSAISDSEFKKGKKKAPPRNASHVETAEKVFPDGSKQVTETIHFADGSKAVKSKVYGPGEYDDDDDDSFDSD